MTRKHLEALSANIREAINPPKRQGATARILADIEPLPILQSRGTAEAEASLQAVRDRSEPNITELAPVSQTAGVTSDQEGMSIGLRAPSVPQPPAVRLTPVRGVTAVPNTVLDNLLPQLEPYEQLVYLRLYRLSHGFRNDTCLVSVDRLATACKISPSSTIRAIRDLERKGMVRRLEAKLGGKMSEIRGNRFWVFRPPVPQTAPVSRTPPVSPKAPVPQTPIKEIDDDYINNNHHQIDPVSQPGAVCQIAPVPRTTGEEREDSDNEASLRHLAQTISTYTQVTKNPWLEADTAVYLENSIQQISLDQVKSVLRAVAERAGSRINSFSYFVKEILATKDSKTIGARRKALAAIVKTVRDNHVGHANYSMSDFVYDVKAACARSGVMFDNDLFNAVVKTPAEC
jgi:DNA-binding Lrp family transcriptional regulator